MEFLSPEWGDEVVRRAADGEPFPCDVAIEVQVTGAPRGRGRISVVIDGGRIVACTPERADGAELKLKVSYEDLAAMFEGTLDPNVAFMTGDMKTDGPTGPLLAILSAWRRPGVVAGREALAAITDPR